MCSLCVLISILIAEAGSKSDQQPEININVNKHLIKIQYLYCYHLFFSQIQFKNTKEFRDV